MHVIITDIVGGHGHVVAAGDAEAIAEAIADHDDAAVVASVEHHVAVGDVVWLDELDEPHHP